MFQQSIKLFTGPVAVHAELLEDCLEPGGGLAFRVCAGKDGGNVRPSILAVFRFRANSNTVGVSIGRSRRDASQYALGKIHQLPRGEFLILPSPKSPMVKLESVRYASLDAAMLGIEREMKGRANSRSVIVAIGSSAASTASDATDTVPIVVFGASPVELRLAANLAHPGGNVTGVHLSEDFLCVDRTFSLIEHMTRRFVVPRRDTDVRANHSSTGGLNQLGRVRWPKVRHAATTKSASRRPKRSRARAGRTNTECRGSAWPLGRNP